MNHQSPSMASQATAELPRLPEPYCNSHEDAGAYYPDMFSATQMNAHYLAGVEAGRASRAQSEWLPIETAPMNETFVLLADIDAEGVIYEVIHGCFEVVAEDEEDGPWSLDGGVPTCSYTGRAAGTYFNQWLNGKEWERCWRVIDERRTLAGCGYTHWAPVPAPATLGETK